MRELRFDIIGEITEGEDAGKFVEIFDDLEVSGGFLIMIYEQIDRSGEVHDHWVETIIDVDGFFGELGWEVRWFVHGDSGSGGAC